MYILRVVRDAKKIGKNKETVEEKENKRSGKNEANG
jgi:hypothetical protein